MSQPPDNPSSDAAATIARCREELRTNPRSLAFVPMAEALESLGQHEEAVVVCRRGLAGNPGESHGRLVLARASLALGRELEAIIELTRLLKEGYRALEVLVLLGEALVGRGDLRRARQSLDRATQLSPDDPGVARLRARVAAAAQGAGARKAAGVAGPGTVAGGARPEQVAPPRAPGQAARPSGDPVSVSATQAPVSGNELPQRGTKPGVPRLAGRPVPPGDRDLPDDTLVVPEDDLTVPGRLGSGSSPRVAVPGAGRPAGVPPVDAPSAADTLGPEYDEAVPMPQTTAPGRPGATPPPLATVPGRPGAPPPPLATVPGRPGAISPPGVSPGGGPPGFATEPGAPAALAGGGPPGFATEPGAPAALGGGGPPGFATEPGAPAALAGGGPPSLATDPGPPPRHVEVPFSTGGGMVPSVRDEIMETSRVDTTPQRVWPVAVDLALRTSVLVGDPPVPDPPAEPSPAEQAWRQAQRRSMLRVWMATLALVAVAGALALAWVLVRRSQVADHFHAAGAEMAAATPATYRSAADRYRQILQLDPDNRRAASHLALALALLAFDYGEGADAGTQAQVQRAWLAESMYLRRAVGTHSPEVSAARVLVALTQGERQEARRLVETALKAHPRSTWVHRAAAATHFAEGDLGAARRELTAAAAAAPAQVGPRLALAALDLEDGAAEKAAATYDAVLQVRPRHPGARIGRALASVDVGDGAAAVARLPAQPSATGGARAPDHSRRSPASVPSREGAASRPAAADDPRGASSGQEAWRQLALGHAALLQGAPAEARVALDRATSGAPPDPRFFLRLARARLDQGHVRAARTALRRGSRYLADTHPSVRLVAAEIALGRGLAVGAMEQLTALEPSPARDYALGRALLAKGAAEPALAPLKRVEAARPADPRVKVYVLLAGLLAGKPTPDAPALGQLRALTKGAAGGLAHFAVGRTLMALDEPRPARPWLEAAQGDHPEVGPAATLLARLLVDAGEPGAALKTLEAILRRGDFVPARVAQGRLYLALGRDADARRALRQALGLEGDPPPGPRGDVPTPDGYVDLAIACAHLGDRTGAVAALAKARDLGATGPQRQRAEGLVLALKGDARGARAVLAPVSASQVAAKVDLAQVTYDSGDRAGAEAILLAALKAAPDNVEVLLALGQLYLVTRGRGSQAIRTFSRALAVWQHRQHLGRSKQAAIQLGLGQAYLQPGAERDPGRARSAFEAAVAQAPRHPDAHLALGRLHAARGEADLAAASLRRALALAPQRADTHFLLAEVVAVSDPARARQGYEEYLRLAPRGPRAGAARQALEKLR